jgi:hypothetical protein
MTCKELHDVPTPPSVCTVNERYWVVLTQAKQEAVPSGAEGAARMRTSRILVKRLDDLWSRVPLNREGPSSIPGQFMWGFWWLQQQWDRFVSEYLGCPLSVSSSHAPHRIYFIYHRHYTILLIDSILQCNISLSKKGRNLALQSMK